MNKTDLKNIERAAIVNNQKGRTYLTTSYIKDKQCALHDIITAAYYAGRAAMAGNIYTTEKPDLYDLNKHSQELLDDCYDCIRYFV